MTQLTSLTFTQLPKLAKIESQYGTTSEQSNPSSYRTILLEDLPELQEISLRGNSLMNFDTVILQNLPKFCHFDYSGKSDGYMSTMKFFGIELQESLNVDLPSFESLRVRGASAARLGTLLFKSRHFWCLD